MKRNKLTPEPGALLEFFNSGLTRLGAVCERTWYDRLDVLAEGAPARLWRQDGALHAAEIQFPSMQQPGARDAATQVFAGCPLTFRLIDFLRQQCASLYRATIAAASQPETPPPSPVAEKLWFNQFGTMATIESQWSPHWHFSLTAAVRCEIQAIDQHWSFHRLALSLADGQPDSALERDLDCLSVAPQADAPSSWPDLAPLPWSDWLLASVRTDVTENIHAVQERQQRYLARELTRLDDYFFNYQQELRARMDRQHKPESRQRYLQRLQAAELEHTRRRDDQIARHEIRVIPHVDALLLTAERAWQATARPRHADAIQARFVPRIRRWIRAPAAPF